MTRIVLLGPANSIHLQRWAAALVERGHALCVLSQHRCERALLPASAEVVWLPHAGSLGYFRNAPAVRRAIAAWRPEILNAHYASGYGSTAAWCGFAPTLLSVWGSDVYDFPNESALKGRLLRHNLRRATQIASTSEAMARQVRRLVPKVGEIAITPFGVDLARFAPAAPRASAGLTIGIVKSLAPKYGVDLLLRAFAGLLRDEAVRALPTPPRLLIVGDGPARAALERKYPDTVFLGARHGEELAEIYAASDIFVFPSKTDTFGLVLLEALASGLPVAAFPVTGPRDVIGKAPVGVLRDDLRAACLEALTIPREACVEFAAGHTWQASARVFVDHALNVRPEGSEDDPVEFGAEDPHFAA